MSNLEKIVYGEDNLIGGEVINSALKSAGAGTYYRGQVLGRTDTTGVYGAFDPDGETGTENIKGICAADLTLAAAGSIPVYITGSSVTGSSLKDSAGESLTITSAIVENAQDNGIIIKVRA